MNYLLEALLMAIGIQIALFIPAFLFRTDKLTDMSYGLTFMVLASYALITGGVSFAKIILYLMLILWAARLVIYLFLRISVMKRDRRFDDIRENLVKFLSFWLMQGLAVWIIMIPSLFYFNSTSDLGLLSFVGLVIWLCGFVIEAIADQQKFYAKLVNKNRWVDVGLWKHSRHPNYFGEIVCWIGVYVFTLSSLNIYQALIALSSPIFITILLVFVTGIPKLEQSADKKFSKDKDYQKYKARTNMLIPWFK